MKFFSMALITAHQQVQWEGKMYIKGVAVAPEENAIKICLLVSVFKYFTSSNSFGKYHLLVPPQAKGNYRGIFRIQHGVIILNRSKNS